jgi:hypothetical protein
VSLETLVLLGLLYVEKIVEDYIVSFFNLCDASVGTKEDL